MAKLADRIFDAQRDLDTAEEELFELLQTVGIADYKRASYDWYDRSFELYGMKSFDLDVTPEAFKAIGDAGFLRFWFNRGDTRTGGEDERYFNVEVENAKAK